jgi:hypothetical protein
MVADLSCSESTNVFVQSWHKQCGKWMELHVKFSGVAP